MKCGNSILNAMEKEIKIRMGVGIARLMENYQDWVGIHFWEKLCKRVGMLVRFAFDITVMWQMRTGFLASMERTAVTELQFHFNLWMWLWLWMYKWLWLLFWMWMWLWK